MKKETMDMSDAERGISDIASSEGDLSDFTAICRLICNNRAISKDRLFKIIKNSIINKSDAVIERKLNIMCKLDLLDLANQKFVLRANGKILVEISNKQSVFSEKIEKAFYFIILFSSKARLQLTSLLQSINEQNGDDKRENIARYFKANIVQEIWNKKTIEKNLTALETTQRLPSMLNNKFSCMEKWLEFIDLIEIRKNGLHANLTSGLISSLLNPENKKNIFGEAATKYYTESKEFRIKQHYRDLCTYFLEGHGKFLTPAGISDAEAVAKFVCLQLLKSNIILEENGFFKLTKKLKKDKILRSVMMGRDGTPKNFGVDYYT